MDFGQGFDSPHFHQFKEKNLDFYSDFMVFLIFMKPNITNNRRDGFSRGADDSGGEG